MMSTSHNINVNKVGYSDYPRYSTTFNSSNPINSSATSLLTSQNSPLNLHHLLF